MNWQTIQAWLFDTSTKRLSLAVIISAVLHFFILGKYALSLPSLHQDLQMIEARIVINQPAPKIEPIVTPQVKESPQKKASKPNEKKKEIEPTKVKESDNTEQVEEVRPIATEPVLSESPPEEPPIQELTSAEAQPEDPMPIVDEPQQPKYSTVETDFDVFMNNDKNRVGEANISYEAKPDGAYQLAWKVEAKGILGLIYPNLVQTSEGNIGENGLKPQVYVYRFGDKASKHYSAKFSWSDQIVNLESVKGIKTEKIVAGTQDFLSFMYQFMFAPPLDTMSIMMTNGKKLGEYEYDFVGEEILDLKFGQVKTYHIQHAKAESEDKTELWLALDYQNVPVKIRKTEKDGTVIEQIATTLRTELPNTTKTEAIP